MLHQEKNPFHSYTRRDMVCGTASRYKYGNFMVHQNVKKCNYKKNRKVIIYNGRPRGESQKCI